MTEMDAAVDGSVEVAETTVVVEVLLEVGMEVPTPTKCISRVSEMEISIDDPRNLSI